jgi:hypothetical protein
MTETALADVTPAVAHGFVEWRRKQKVARSGKPRPSTPTNHPAAQTVHDDVRRLRAIFKVAVDKDLTSLAHLPSFQRFAEKLLRRKWPRRSRLLAEESAEV